MIDDAQQSRKTTVVEKTAFLMRPQAPKRRCPVTLVGRTFCLKIVNANLRGRMHIPTRLGEKRLDMTEVAARLSAEQFIAALGCFSIETALRRLWRRNSELIKVKRW